MDRRIINIWIPALPERRLGPNASRRQHWGTTTRIREEFRQTVLIAALAAKQHWERQNDETWAPLESASWQIRVFIPDRRYIMDDDNAIACLKSGRDVLQVEMRTNGGVMVPGAGLIVDDRAIRTTAIDWVPTDDRAGMYWSLMSAD